MLYTNRQSLFTQEGKTVARRHADADMTQGSIWKHLLTFGVSMGLGLLFQQLYNTVDTIVVGQFVGKEALAAVGSTGALLNTMVGLSAGVSMGATVVISQSYGAHDQKRLHSAVQTSVALIIMSVVLTAAGLLLTEPLLRMMDTPADVFEEAVIYVRIYFAGLTGLLFYNIGSSIMRAVGDSRRPLYFLITSAILNTVFDLLFVVAFGMGVEGVGYATILAQGISALLVVFSLTREHSAYSIRWSQLHLDKDICKSMMSVGIPTAIQNAVTSFSNVFVQIYINYFGSACMAGWSAYSKLDAFLMIPMQALSMGETTLVGQNFGAGNLRRARQGVKQSKIMSVSVTAAMALTIVLLADKAMLLFTSEPDVIEYGVRFIRLNSLFYILPSYTTMVAGGLRGIGDAKKPSIAFLASYVAFRQLYLAVVRLLGNSLSWVAFGYPMGWIAAALMMTFFYRRSVLGRGRLETAAQ